VSSSPPAEWTWTGATPPIYGPSDTALVVVDPYNDFLSEGGKVWPRVAEVVESVGTVARLQELIEAARAFGMTIVVAPHRRWRPGSFAGWKRLARPYLNAEEHRIFEDGSWGGTFHEGIGLGAQDIVCYEHWAANGFAGTDLDLLLRNRGIENVILAGMTAPGCVEGTGRAAAQLGYSVTLVPDATAAFTAEHMHAAHTLTGPLYADAIATTSQLLATLRARRANSSV
jgi:nicotinamidase-related amidase